MARLPCTRHTFTRGCVSGREGPCVTNERTNGTFTTRGDSRSRLSNVRRHLLRVGGDRGAYSASGLAGPRTISPASMCV